MRTDLSSIVCRLLNDFLPGDPEVFPRYNFPALKHSISERPSPGRLSVAEYTSTYFLTSDYLLLKMIKQFIVEIMNESVQVWPRAIPRERD